MSELFKQLQEYNGAKTAKLVRPIVPIEEWVNSPYYASPDIETLYPFWKNHMIKIFNSETPINEIILHGSLGGGKSTFACFLALRKIYELSCYDIPQKLFNLQVSSVISAVLFSVNKEVAESGIYGQLRALIDTTPYFQQVFPRDKNLKYDVIWSDKRMRVGYGSNANDQIGQNMYFAVLDEGNFFQGEGTLSSKASTAVSKSQSLYLAIRRRGENRFSSGGLDYSLSVLISSARTSNSMVEKRIEATRGKKNVYVIHAVSYEITPEKYSKDKFWCFIGNDLLDPLVVNSVSDLHNILDSIQEPWPESDNLTESIKMLPERYQELFTQVPMNLKTSYESDIISALQDLSGISVSPMGRLFTSRKHFNECIDENAEHPFIQDEFVISTGSEVQIKDYLKSNWKPKDLDKPRFIHIDQSTTTDSTGISMCYIDKIDTGPNGEPLPHITVDFMLRINPPLAPNHIDIAKCRYFVLYLRNNLGVRIGKCTYDQFQCLSPDTRVITENEYKEINDVVVGDKILTRNGYKLVNNVIKYNNAECYKIKLSNGTTLTMSQNHRMSKFVGYKNNKPQFDWVKAYDLKVGDKIQKLDTKLDYSKNKLSRDYIIKGEVINEVTEPLAYLLGYYIGDGNLSANRSSNGSLYYHAIKYTCGSFNECTNLMEKFQDLHIYDVKLSQRAETYFTVTLNSREFIKMLDELGFNPADSKTKRVPESVFGWSQENIANFVAGYIDADGYVCTDSNHGNVVINSVNRDLLVDVNRLMSQFLGIQSSVSNEIKVYKSYVEGEHIRYHLRTSGNQEALKILSSNKVWYRKDWLKGRNKYFYTIESIEECMSDVVALQVDGEEFIADGFVSHNSSESRQQLEIAGIPTDLLSVDRTATEYKQFCDLIYANRISFYRYPRMEKELFELIYYRDRDKIDHPPVQQGGTKDVMDSLVGAVTNALNSDELTNIQRAGDVDILLRIL